MTTQIPHFGIQHEAWEDSYTATEFGSFADLLDCWQQYAEDALFGRWNIPVWLHYDDGRIQVGLMGSRHGECWQWIASATPEQQHELRVRMLNLWAGRADTGFERYPPLPDTFDA
jgi:hypothetical protein